MVSLLYFIYLNKLVRMKYLLEFNNTIIGKMIYQYNKTIISNNFEDNNTTIEDNIKSENITNKKRKLNAYQIFIKNNYNKIKNENPFLTSKEIISILGKEWTENKNNHFNSLSTSLLVI